MINCTLNDADTNNDEDVWTEPSTRRISSRAMRPGVGEEPDP